ncbi:MAG: DNA polymerase III subunit chi [Alphaproteobacteria bacterium]
MTRVDFYHLQKWPLERALPQLLDKVLRSGQRAVVLSASRERVEALNALLWTTPPDSWLPHGSAADGDADLQPIWLTETDHNPNRADVIVLTDGADTPRKGDYSRCLDLFNGNDPEALERARSRWRVCRDVGYELHYWQQTDSGRWQEKT